MKYAYLFLLVGSLVGCCGSNKTHGTAIESRFGHELTYRADDGSIHHLNFWNFSCPQLENIIKPGEKFTVFYKGSEDDAHFLNMIVEEPKP